MQDKLFEQTSILNLDNISKEAIITATVGGEKLILSKEKLFSLIGPRRRKPASVKKKVK